MNESSRARPGPSGGWDRARRAYVAMLGDDDPAAPLLAAGVVDLRLGFAGSTSPTARAIVSAPGDLVELREIVEAATGVGSWPPPPDVVGEITTARIALPAAAPALGLLLAMEGLIERRSPWGRWRTVVDTMAARVAALDAVTVRFATAEPGC